MDFGISLPADPPTWLQVQKAAPAESCGADQRLTTIPEPEAVIESYGRHIIPAFTRKSPV